MPLQVIAAVHRLLRACFARGSTLAGVTLVVVLGGYLRLSSSRALDVSATPFSSFAGAAESPVCEGPREEPKLTNDAGGVMLLHAARPSSSDRLDAAPKLRERSASSHGLDSASCTAPLARISALATSRGAPHETARLDAPARRRARSMVFLN